MTRISQIIAVVGGVTSDTKAQIEQLVRDVTEVDLLTGLDRSYRPRNDQDAPLPGQVKRVQVTVDDVIVKMRALLTRRWDVARTLDEANADAHADVVVDGQVILADVNPGHLLYLERELADLHANLAKVPVLDPAKAWTSKGTEPGQHKTAPVETERTVKVPYNHELSPATQYHAANVQVMARDEVHGYWTVVDFSGAIDPKRKRLLLDRLTQLREAVKFAREEANSAQVDDEKEGKAIFDWLLR